MIPKIINKMIKMGSKDPKFRIAIKDSSKEIKQFMNHIMLKVNEE